MDGSLSRETRRAHDDAAHAPVRFNKATIARGYAGASAFADPRALQRLLGNRSTTQVVRASHLTLGAAGGAAADRVIQRNGSTEQFAKMVTPKPFKGPTVEVQDQLVVGLDKEIDAEILKLDAEVIKLKKQYDALAPNAPSPGEPEGEERAQARREVEELRTDLRKAWNAKETLVRRYNSVTFIGAIILADPIGKKQVGELIDSAKLIDLEPTGSEASLAHSLERSSYPLVVRGGLEKHVVTNTLATMQAAGQIEYLRASDLINDKFVVVIEVHYYRSRGLGETAFHKDTRGQTLFVNLNFTNVKKILGPEILINPASDDVYDEYVKKNLPEVFVSDLTAARKALAGQKRSILATVVPKKGVVAFIDEAVHHKTPTEGHRTAAPDAIAKALKNAYGDEYDDADKAYKAYKSASRLSPWTWRSYLKEPAKSHANDWYTVMDKLAKMQGSRKGENRLQIAIWLPAYFHGEIDAIIEEGSYGDFGKVGYSHVLKDDKGKAKILTVPVKAFGEEPLKRTTSSTDLSKYAASQPTTGEPSAGQPVRKRTFFRTWVRAVPRGDIGGI